MRETDAMLKIMSPEPSADDEFIRNLMHSTAMQLDDHLPDSPAKSEGISALLTAGMWFRLACVLQEALGSDIPDPVQVDMPDTIDTMAKTPAKTSAKTPAKTSAKTPAKTSAKTPAKTSAKTPAKTSAKPRVDGKTHTEDSRTAKAEAAGAAREDARAALVEVDKVKGRPAALGVLNSFVPDGADLKLGSLLPEDYPAFIEECSRIVQGEEATSEVEADNLARNMERNNVGTEQSDWVGPDIGDARKWLIQVGTTVGRDKSLYILGLFVPAGQMMKLGNVPKHKYPEFVTACQKALEEAGLPLPDMASESAPTPEPAKTPPPGPVSLADVRSALVDHAKRHGRENTTFLIARFVPEGKPVKLMSVAESDWAELIQEAGETK